ncbi:MAG: DNA/RNA nuclease SfsA [Pseudomonadota bacterium]
MDLPSPLLEGTLVSRYKRFFADVRLDDGTFVTAHCPNPGAMLGLKDPGLRAFLSTSDNPKRKLKHTLELVEADDGIKRTLVGINTGRPNALVEEAILAGRLLGLDATATLRREVKYGASSRIDILLQAPDGAKTYVEVKNVHLVRSTGLAEFPDSVTTRGAKHLAELADMVAEGHRAVMVYLVQRGDCTHLDLARDIDPAYGKAFDAARVRGVEAMAIGCTIDPTRITANQPITLAINA